MSYAKKEIRTVLRGLRKFADPPSSFEMVQNKHIRVKWDMKNDSGETVTLRATIGWSPSDPSWFKSHKKQMERKFKEMNISEDINYI